MKNLFIVVIAILFQLNGTSQNIDSLWSVTYTQIEDKDTSALNSIYTLAQYIKYVDPDTTLYILDKGIEFANKQKVYDYPPLLLEIKGDAYWQLSKFRESIEMYEEAKSIFASKGQRDKVGYMHSSIGYIYMDMGQFETALNNYQAGLAIAEELDFPELEIVTLSYLGVIYKKLNQYDKALDTYRKTLQFYTETKHSRNILVSCNNIGTIFYETDQPDSAIHYFNISLSMAKETNDQKNLANSLLNLGNIALDQEKYDSAEDYFLEAIGINEKRSDVSQLIQNYINLSNTYFNQDNLNKAYSFILKAKELSDNTDNIEYKSTVEQNLADYFQKKKDFKKALFHYQNHINLKDSVLTLETSKQINRLAAVYENERNELEIQNLEKDQKLQQALISKNESKIKQQEITQKQEKMFRIGLFIGIALLIVIAIIIFIGSRNKTKANDLISHQKEIVEEKNSEILASINYAKRIQAAILPPSKIVKEYLPHSFILYKPKDIVAGDFYWLEHKDNKILFAAADCTGHGVPGAMVSVICNNALNRSVREHGLTDPGEILNRTREIVIQEFEKSDEDVKDGMDIAICSLEGDCLKYAGAHNPLWIVRNGELIETKANKQPIGKFDKTLPYSTHTFKLIKNDSFYIFSDGYVDQFGGVKGKKFKAKAFRELLLSIQNKPMEEQRIILDNTFETWRGDLEQIDDICVIGVKV